MLPCPGVLLPLCLNIAESSLSGSFWGKGGPTGVCQPVGIHTHFLVTLANLIRTVALGHLICSMGQKFLRGLQCYLQALLPSSTDRGLSHSLPRDQ